MRLKSQAVRTRRLFFIALQQHSPSVNARQRHRRLDRGRDHVLGSPQFKQPGQKELRRRIVLALLASISLAYPAVASETSQTTRSRDSVACLAEAVYFEARGTTDRGALAVAHVVVNRQESSKFPGTICGVVHDGCQFSYQCDGRPEVLADRTERARAYRAAEAVLAGESSDPTQGALFFHSSGARPGWFSSRPRIGEIAGNVFYR
jgi:N-acetylmuramoyl-L-alanine amidase